MAQEVPDLRIRDVMAERRPGYLHVGDVARHRTDPEREPDAGLYFLVVVVCSLCGYTMLFDSDKFHTSKEITMYRGDEEPPDLP